MEIVGVLLFIGVLLYLSSYLNNRDNKPVLSDDDAPLQSSKQILSGHIKDNLDWLAPRWELAEKLKQDGDLTSPTQARLCHPMKKRHSPVKLML